MTLNLSENQIKYIRHIYIYNISENRDNVAENKKNLTYAPAQDHYGDCIQGLIFFVTDS